MLGKKKKTQSFKDFSKFTVASNPLDKELLYAARIADVAKMKALLAQGANLDAQDYCGDTALLYSFKHNNYEEFKEIMLLQPNMDIQNREGYTILMYTAANGQSEWVEALLNAGADFTLCNMCGWTAEEMAKSAHGGGRRGGDFHRTIGLLQAARLNLGKDMRKITAADILQNEPDGGVKLTPLGTLIVRDSARLQSFMLEGKASYHEKREIFSLIKEGLPSSDKTAVIKTLALLNFNEKQHGGA